MCSFCWNLTKIFWVSYFVEFVLGRFSHFNIAIAYSNSKLCGAWTPSFCEFTCNLGKTSTPLQSFHWKTVSFMVFWILLWTFLHITRVTYFLEFCPFSYFRKRTSFNDESLEYERVTVTVLRRTVTVNCPVHQCWINFHNDDWIPGCARFAEIASELTKAWSSGATEFGIWIGNCNVKVWKSTEDKLHKIWNSKYFSQIWAKRANPWAVFISQSHTDQCRKSTHHWTGIQSLIRYPYPPYRHP